MPTQPSIADSATMEPNGTITRTGIYTEYQVPFCRPIQCSLTVKADANGKEVWYVNGQETFNVLWSCLHSECQAYITGLLAVIVMLAVMTITFNCLILGINLMSKTRRMRKRNPTMNNYSNYVVSLAVADLLLGVIVLPLCVANFYFEFLSNPIEFSKVGPSPTPIQIGASSLRATENATAALGTLSASGAGLVASDGGVDDGFATASAWQMVMNPIVDKHLPPVLVRDMLGFFTHLTLFVSVYTLISASADRFYAASHSIRLSASRTHKTPGDTKSRWMKKAFPSVRRSTVAVFTVWFLGILFAVMPLVMRPYFYFRHVGHVFAAMTSDQSYGAGVKWYLFILVLPLIGMWALNLMICFTLWRRKSQLGLRRRQSLHRKLMPGSSSTSGAKAPGYRVASLPDSVFEPVVDENKAPIVLKYPACRWNQPETKNDAPETKNGAKAASAKQKALRSGGGSASPPSNQSSLRGSRSGLKRKVSSIRRAKELLRNQSYEANITKTLCIVVIAFTIAVLPLIVVLSSIARAQNSEPEALNNEVTALTCSLLLLFSNSFVNCVIYGARMRDFRTAVGQLFRAFFDRIKNTLCCSCLRGNDGQSFGSDSVTSVLHFARHSRHGTSPRLAAELKTKFRRTHASSETITDSRSDSKRNSNETNPAPTKETYVGDDVAKPVTILKQPQEVSSEDRKESPNESAESTPDPCLFRGRSAIYTRRQHSERSTAPNSLSRFSWRSGSLKDDTHCAGSMTPSKHDVFQSSSDSSRDELKATKSPDGLDCNGNGVPEYVLEVPDNLANVYGVDGEFFQSSGSSEGDRSSKISRGNSTAQTSEIGSEAFYEASDFMAAMDIQIDLDLDLDCESTA